MPEDLIKSYAKKTDKSEKELESLWDDAQKQAKKMGQGDNYAYITAIFKKMAGMSESLSDLFMRSKYKYKTFQEFVEKERVNIQEIISSDIDVVPEKTIQIVQRGEKKNVKVPEIEKISGEIKIGTKHVK